MRRALRDDTGATMVEYGLMVSAIAAVAYLAVQALGPTVSGWFQSLTNLF